MSYPVSFCSGAGTYHIIEREYLARQQNGTVDAFGRKTDIDAAVVVVFTNSIEMCAV